MEDAFGEYFKEEWESLRTGTGSLSILVASLRAKVSLIFSTCFGRNEGNDNSAKHTVPPLRFFIGIVIVDGAGAGAKLAVTATIVPSSSSSSNSNSYALCSIFDLQIKNMRWSAF